MYPPDTEALREHPLGVALDAAVPLWIRRVQDYSPAWRASRASQCASIVAHKGDVILYRSGRKSETARAFNALAEGLALMAFQPGGVRFAGRHWEAEQELAS